jgi:hypothetical protein
MTNWSFAIASRMRVTHAATRSSSARSVALGS